MTAGRIVRGPVATLMEGRAARETNRVDTTAVQWRAGWGRCGRDKTSKPAGIVRRRALRLCPLSRVASLRTVARQRSPHVAGHENCKLPDGPLARCVR